MGKQDRLPQYHGGQLLAELFESPLKFFLALLALNEKILENESRKSGDFVVTLKMIIPRPSNLENLILYGEIYIFFDKFVLWPGSQLINIPDKHFAHQLLLAIHLLFCFKPKLDSILLIVIQCLFIICYQLFYCPLVSVFGSRYA